MAADLHRGDLHEPEAPHGAVGVRLPRIAPGGEAMSEVLRGGEPLDVAKPDDEDERLWSVTTVLGVLDRPALMYWAAEQTALAAVHHVDAWRSIEESSGTQEAVKWLTGARFRAPKGERTAAELGTAVHKACEEYALTGVAPEVDGEVRPYFEQWDRWLQEFTPSYVAAELTVYSPTYGVAGTLDGIFTLADGTTTVFDLKTSKKALTKAGKPTPIYPETALQLAGYAHAEFAALWRPRRFESFRRRYYALSRAERDQAVPVPAVDGGLGIKITPESCIAYPVRCDEEIYEAFLWCLEVARWTFEISKTVIGEPLLAPGAEVAA